MFKSISNLLRKPSAQLLAQKELEDAMRSLLEARSGVEYAAAMVTYHETRVQRLKEYTRHEA